MSSHARPKPPTHGDSGCRGMRALARQHPESLGEPHRASPGYCWSGPILLRQTSGGGRSRRNEIPLQSASELVVTWPVASGTCCRGTEEVVASPQDRGCCGERGGAGTRSKGKVWIRRKKNEIKNSDRPPNRALCHPKLACRWPSVPVAGAGPWVLQG